MRLGHTIEDSRKKYPEITDEILDSLQKWANDRGLPNIPKEQLALFAHSCYFDIEATRQCMNVYYSMRATTPELFNNRDSNLDLQQSLKTLEFAILPKPDQNGNWIIVYRLADPRPSQYIFNDSLKLLFMSYDVSLYTNGCSEGYILLVDMAKTQFGHLIKLSINSLRKSLEYVQEGMPLRLKAIYVVNAPWFMDKVIALMRPFMKQKLFEIIHIYSGDISDLYSHIPPECLPKDYDGELDCVANLHKAYCMKLDQLRNYFREEEALFRNYSPNNVRTAGKQIMPDTTENLKD
ncbi:PREDICTED: alpha-tocopherol transfer protein-like [Trachymyrmex cornetzi]|uniref:Alpha-tocopherol transfer protein-like protein n=1 Tax=Trachymyrmex cornetzi TaxID=471704 RepID=A0A151J957_9HYME|nr:PREDICTED: alpha-tocopherol transfer protein-like [Trachymyrmex cornetzi]KYN21598.1 Alpha-tocopherol transfer protein-like protein [Trachymyrmex cornetzi]